DREETIGGYYEALVDATVDHWEKEYRCLKKDGGYATVIDKASILRDDAGNAIRVIGAIKDVTGQKRAEEELRKSNERFILASRAASDAIFDWDLAAGKIQWGEGIEGLFGHPSAQVQPQRFESLVHPDERARVKQGLDDALAHRRKKLWKDECRFAAADGSYRHVLLRGFIQRYADGTPLRIIGSMQDISDRKYNEILLSLERTVFEMSANPGTQLSKIIDKLLQGMEQLLPGAIAAVMELKSDDSIQFIGRSRLPQEMQDKLCIKLNAADDHTLSTCCFGKQAVFTNDIASVAANDPFRRILEPFGFRACWSLPVIYSSGRVMGVLAVFFTEARDATEDDTATAERIRDLLRIIVENRWSLREIRTANERFDIAMQATHDLIWDWDLTTNEIYRDSVGLLKVYGIARRESVNTLAKWLSRVHPEDQDHVAAVVNDILQATIEKTFEVEYRFQRDDGSYANVYDRGIILRNAEGKPIRMIGAAQDITERKRLEQEVLHNELARKKAISQATIDTQERERSEIGKELHDNVNQVLTTTKLYLDLALSTPGMRDELLKKSSTNIIGVINEIRQLSRSLMDPSIGDLGLIDSIHDLIENINLTGKLRVRIRADKKAEVNLDKNQKLTIFRIIQEALNNAMRHADAKTVTLTLAVQHDTLFLEIEDDGKGFDVKSVRKGAGLKNIENRVYLINGNYSIESSINHGSLIKINFPLPKTKDKSN
ncbi:MAG TPA: PAS domain-containing protein, partial [Flavisolibacter sp.]